MNYIYINFFFKIYLNLALLKKKNLKRFVQVINAGPFKTLKKDDSTNSSTQTTESTNHLINSSKLKYLFNAFFKIKTIIYVYNI